MWKNLSLLALFPKLTETGRWKHNSNCAAWLQPWHTHTTEVGNWVPHYRQGRACWLSLVLKSVYSYSVVALGPSNTECSEKWQGDLLYSLVLAVLIWVTWDSILVLPDCCQSLFPSLLTGWRCVYQEGLYQSVVYCKWFCPWPKQEELINSLWMDYRSHLFFFFFFDYVKGLEMKHMLLFGNISFHKDIKH